MNEKDKIYQKWAPLFNNLGLTGSQLDSLSQLSENQSKQILEENTLATEDTSNSNDFPTLLPIAMKVAAKTIGSEIGGFASKQEIDAVKSRLTQENRDGKLGSILDDKPFTEKKLEDDEEYKELMKKGVTPMSAPSNSLFYLDYTYGTGSII